MARNRSDSVDKGKCTIKNLICQHIMIKNRLYVYVYSIITYYNYERRLSRGGRSVCAGSALIHAIPGKEMT